KPSDALVVYLPRGVRVAVNDPALQQEVLFETDAAATAINAAFAAVIVPTADPEAGADRELVTIYDDKSGTTTWVHSFDPFGPTPSAQAAFFIGIVLRPLLAQDPDNYSEDRFPVGPLDLYVDAVQVFDTDPSGLVVSGPLAHDCPAPGTDDTPTGRIEWQ